MVLDPHGKLVLSKVMLLSPTICILGFSNANCHWKQRFFLYSVTNNKIAK